MPTLVGVTRDEGKLFAPLPRRSFGGPPGSQDRRRDALLDDAELQPGRAHHADHRPTSSIPPLPAGGDARHGLRRHDRAASPRPVHAPSRDNLLNTLKTQQANVWHYQFDWAQEPYPWNEVYGAAHAFDLGFVFGNFGPSLFSNATNSAANRPGRLALSDAMMASIGAFMRTGDPNTSALGTSWAPWPSKLLFDASRARTHHGNESSAGFALWDGKYGHSRQSLGCCTAQYSPP